MHKIRREERTTISEVIVRGKREILSKLNKIGIGFISISLLKARVSYLVGLLECFPVKSCILPSDSEAKRDGADAEFPFPLFPFLFLPHLRTLAHDERSENCLRFATSGPSPCLYPLV